MTSAKPAARCQLLVKERILLTPPISVKPARRFVIDDLQIPRLVARREYMQKGIASNLLRRSCGHSPSSPVESRLRPSSDSFSNCTLRLPMEETLPLLPGELVPRSYWSHVEGFLEVMMRLSENGRGRGRDNWDYARCDTKNTRQRKRFDLVNKTPFSFFSLSRKLEKSRSLATRLASRLPRGSPARRAGQGVPGPVKVEIVRRQGEREMRSCLSVRSRLTKGPTCEVGRSRRQGRKKDENPSKGGEGGRMVQRGANR